MSFAGLVVLARSLNPIPSRTRPLNSSAPMVLWLKPWESRSLPGLQRTSPLFTSQNNNAALKPQRGVVVCPDASASAATRAAQPCDRARGTGSDTVHSLQRTQCCAAVVAVNAPQEIFMRMFARTTLAALAIAGLGAAMTTTASLPALAQAAKDSPAQPTGP